MRKRLFFACLTGVALLASCQAESDQQASGTFWAAENQAEDYISLSGDPQVDVTLTLSNLYSGEASLFPAAVMFDKDNWNGERSLSVTCIDDKLVTGNRTQQFALIAVSSDPTYNGIRIERAITCQDDEDQSTNFDVTRVLYNDFIRVSPESAFIPEGTSTEFKVSLRSQPLAPVFVMAQPINDRNNAASLDLFTSRTCLKPQKTTIYGSLDADDEYLVEMVSECDYDNEWQQIDLIASNLTHYRELIANSSVPVDSQTIVDPVDPGIGQNQPDPDQNQPDPGIDDGDEDETEPVVNPDELFNISESFIYIQDSGTSKTFTIAPSVRPSKSITVYFVVSDGSEATVSPSSVTFTRELWQPQTVTVTGVSDQVKDGTQTFEIQFDVESYDEQYDGAAITPVYVQSADDDFKETSSVKFRAMAANITSGSKQSYSQGHGIRIFQAVKPDIVLINEFNMYSGSSDKEEDIRALVDKAFGTDFYYHHGNGDIPNGIISRFPIISSGSWKSNIIKNRDWDWAVIDMPGPKDMLAVSVHLSTGKNAQEMPLLINEIQKKVEHDAKLGYEYYVMIGGDFNTTSRKTVTSYMSSVFMTQGPYPVDQKGNSNTNAKRSSPYDWLLCSPDLCKKEIPVEIGAHTGELAYTNGHVFDSRVYANFSVSSNRDKEISYVSPVQSNDSGASNMQHMAVIRDFEYTY